MSIIREVLVQTDTDIEPQRSAYLGVDQAVQARRDALGKA